MTTATGRQFHALADGQLSGPIFAGLINLIGRQRMLSQRVGLILLNLHIARLQGLEIGAADLAAYAKAAEDFRCAHRTLINGNRDTKVPSLFSEGVRDVLYGKRDGNRKIEGFIDATGFYEDVFANAKEYEAARLLEFVTFIKSELLELLQANVAELEADYISFQRACDQQREEETRSVLAALSQIQKSAHLSRLVAFNAKISSIRAGEYGREFGALTDELKKISDEIGESSKLIVRNISRQVA